MTGTFTSLFLKPTDPNRFEVALRATLTCLLAFVLSVGDFSKVNPPTTAFMTGILGSTFAVMFPTLMFSIGAIFPSVILTTVLTLLFASMLLAAATVSTGFYIFVFAIYALVACGQHFGKNYASTSTQAGMLICIAVVISISSLSIVQDGFTKTLDLPPLDGGETLQWIRDALGALCLQQGQNENCWEDALPALGEPIEVVIPGGGDFGGQTVFLTPNLEDGTVVAHIPGGLFWVQLFWTAQGTTNPLAVNRNFMISFCWGVAIIIFVQLLPPFRTARGFITRGLLNKSLKLAAKDGKYDADTKEEEFKKDGADMIRLMNALDGGNVSGLTLFEPRVKAPLENLVVPLKTLGRHVGGSLLAKAAAITWINDEREGLSEEECGILDQANEMLTASADALASPDETSLRALRELRASHNDHEKLAIENFSPVRYAFHRARTCMDATIEWIDAFNHPKQSFSNAKVLYPPWLLGALLPVIRFFEILSLPFRPKRWNLRSFLWSVKWVLGFVILVIMQVYWGAYASFGIETGLPGVSGVYAGWQHISYAFCWMPTVEGTFKKGLQRCLGTCLGGFAAWLSIIVTSGSYDDSAAINSSGLVAWLTITSGIVAYFTVGKGVLAYSGGSSDHGYIGMYFVMTQALIALEVWAGLGTKGDLVTNRVVATLTGAILAIIVALIPPARSGRHPIATQMYLNALREMFVTFLGRGLDPSKIQSSFEEFHDTSLKDCLAKRKYATFLLNDASRLAIADKWLPWFQVDPKLRAEMNLILVTEGTIEHCMQIAHYLFREAGPEVAEQNPALSMDPGSPLRSEIERMISELSNDQTTPEEPKLEDVSDVGPYELDRAHTCMVQLIQKSSFLLKKHQSVLDEIKESGRHYISTKYLLYKEPSDY